MEMLSNISLKKKKKRSHCLCRLMGWALSRTLESWLLSNNLISQMEKQHLFSCSSTYGSHCCCAEPKQVTPMSTALRSPAAPRDRPVPLGCEGHRLPRQLEARTSSAYAKHPSRCQFVGGKMLKRVFRAPALIFLVWQFQHIYSKAWLLKDFRKCLADISGAWGEVKSFVGRVVCAYEERKRSIYARIKIKCVYFFSMARDYFWLCNVFYSAALAGPFGGIWSWSQIKIARLFFLSFFSFPFHMFW